MIYLYSFLGLGGLAVLIWIVRSLKSWGNLESENERLEKDLKAARDRNEIEDNIIRLSPDARRVRLGKWAIQTDKTDDE